jgi:hypothetical protein
LEKSSILLEIKERGVNLTRVGLQV